MIFCVIGGSAHSTPVLIDALARAVPEREITVRLAGRDDARLQAVARACNLLAAGTRIHTEAFAEDSWDRALTGSHVVLIQARIGGYAGRAFDETFPLSLGIPGDEGLGPGGLSAAYRSWGQMRDIFGQVRSIAPRAQTILLSSPCSLLVRLAALALPGWPLVGTCELPSSTLDQLCAATGAQTDHVSFGYTGVNHLGFLHHVYEDPEGCESHDLVTRYAAQRHTATFPSSDLVSRLGAFPLKYLRLHFEPEKIVVEQRRRPNSRAGELALLAEHSFSVFRDGNTASIRHALSARRADWYELAVLPLLLSQLHLPVARPVFLTVADANGEVRERAYVQRNGTFDPLPQPAPAPPAVNALVDGFINYERAAAQAILAPSVSALANALALHPSLPHRHARALAQAILDQPFARTPEPKGGAMPDLNVAILGCGRMGRERARCVIALGANIAAVYDPDAERATALAAQFGATPVTSEHEIPWGSLDAVFFCTPPQCREAQALSAIAAGVAFMAEKPVGLSHHAAERVASALARAPVVNAIGYMNRCRSSVRHTRALLADTRLLGLAGFWVCRQYTVPWWLDAAASGGPLNEQATHLFDLCRVFGGEIASVQSIAADTTRGSAESLGAASTIQFHTGSIGTVFYSCESSGKSIGLHLFTDRGSIDLAGWDFRMTTNTIDGTLPDVAAEEDIFLLETEQFLNAVRSGRPQDVHCNWTDAMHTQAAVDAARACLDENRVCETAAVH